jgi:hypothetical protein
LQHCGLSSKESRRFSIYSYFPVSPSVVVFVLGGYLAYLPVLIV